ncbi:MAG: hypothetical protein ABSF67_06095 [Roseiarcus sp.]
MANDAAEDLEERKAATAPESRSAPPLGAVAAARSEPAPAAAARGGVKFRLAAAARRYGDGAALVAVAVLYCVWPNDFAPDRKWYGGADDVVFIVLLAYLARRVIKRSPTLLDLPGAISRAVGRTLRRSR